jgi:hypothetical protein
MEENFNDPPRLGLYPMPELSGPSFNEDDFQVATGPATEALDSV